MERKAVDLVLLCPVCSEPLKDPLSLPCGHHSCLKCVQLHPEEEQRLCPECGESYSLKSMEQLPMCHEHNQEKTMFCQTDLQVPHRGLQTVTSASERALREAQLGALSEAQLGALSEAQLETQRHLLLQSLQHKDTERTSLLQQEQDIKTSAHTALQLSRDSFRDIILLLETRAKEVEQQIQSELERGLSRVREIQDQVKQELSELQQRLCDLDTLSLTKDHNSFTQLHTEGPVTVRGLTEGPVPVRGLTEGPVPVRGLTEGPIPVHTGTRSLFEEVSRAVSELRERLQLTVEEARTNISLALSPVQVLVPEPKTREEFLQYSTDFTLDINTANTWLSLSEGDRRVTVMGEKQKYPDHQDRFTDWSQVLSRQSVTGRCYWEVEWSGDYAEIAVSYRDMPRPGAFEESAFGLNDRSWSLVCRQTESRFWFNSVESEDLGPVGSRVGVFLDHSAGVLSFYSVCENQRLIHREQTVFSRPVHAGLTLDNVGDTALFLKLK